MVYFVRVTRPLWDKKPFYTYFTKFPSLFQYRFVNIFRFLMTYNGFEGGRGPNIKNDKGEPLCRPYMKHCKPPYTALMT